MGTLKSKLDDHQIEKCFITGVSPLSIDRASGFNIAAFCGLSEKDVLDALRLPNVCTSEDELLRHFKIMKDNYNGYRFAPSNQVPQASEIATSKPAWASYMFHTGGLTFCGDTKRLQIPNIIAADCFADATLTRLQLRLEDVKLALENILS
ncbi:hypothetical protein BGX34_002242 [Mortierella sp. NVP85]|nr:hypothetical protein BGX34_002242 [Mortierella sp. NVP85]